MQQSVITIDYSIHCNTDSIKTMLHSFDFYNQKLPFTISQGCLSFFPATPAASFSLSFSHHLSFYFFLLIFSSLSFHSCSQWPWHVLFPVSTGVLLFHSCQVTSGLLAVSRTTYFTLSLCFLSYRMSNTVYLL